MLIDMYIPWTPRLGGLRKPAPAPPQPQAAPTPGVCDRTLHIAKIIITDAVKPFPEAARAIGLAFLAYYRGQLDIEALLARPTFPANDP